MAQWTKLENFYMPLKADDGSSLALPLTIDSADDQKSVSSKYVNTRDNDTIFFRWYLESTDNDGMKVDVSLVSVYGGETITLAETDKTVSANSKDELIVQFSPNVPGGTLANNADRIQLGMGNPNYLGENTFSVVRLSYWGGSGAGTGNGKINAVECYVMTKD